MPTKEKAPPEPTTVTQTPSGIEIAFYAEPRRYYEVRHAPLPEGLPVAALYPPEWYDWREVPSVTNVLGVLDKPGLPWWGQGVAVEGMINLWDQGLLTRAEDGRLAIQNAEQTTWVYADLQSVVDQLTLQKLTVNHTVKKAGDRGQGAHDAFEAWAATGEIPTAENFPPDEQPYIRGLRAFCEDVGDSWETDGIEVAVGSVEHGFAGRYDLRGKFTQDVKLVTQSLTKDGKGPLKRGVKTTVIPGGTLGLVDLKTSKRVYTTHLMQLEAYEGAGVECGLMPTDWRAVLHITQFGTYEIKRARATYEDFLACLTLYNAQERLKEVL